MTADSITRPDIDDARQLLAAGHALRAANRAAEAVGMYQRAVAVQPLLADAHLHLGNALKSLRQFHPALTALAEATRLAPDDAAAWLNRGVAHLELRQFADAVACFRRAATLEPHRAEAHNILAVALTEQGCATDAVEAATAALALKPDYPAALNNLARAYRAQGRMRDAVDCYRRALAQRADPATHSNLVYSLNFLDDLPPTEVAAEHGRWDALHAQRFASAASPHPNDRAPDRRLRVGFVSADLCLHSVAYFLEPLLAARDPLRIEAVCFSDVRKPDAMTDRLRSLSDGWHDVAGRSDDALAALIRQETIDVLVDLAGHTAGNRLLVFARRPAPVQVTWLGYPNTTGMVAMDYRLTDAVADPAGRTEAWHRERLARLDGPFLCYAPPGVSPDVGDLPARDGKAVTFGCFNKIAKVTPATIETWAEILRVVPNSRLLLKSRGLDDDGTIARLRGEFARHGIAAERLEFNGARLSVADHLALYGRVDIALDTFPYNGTTTTCEALWMGVPVVTLAGATHVGRVGASLLTHLGTSDWIAQSKPEYVATAGRLAGDLPRLVATRATLRAQMRASRLCDAAGFSAQFEQTLRRMWADWCEQSGAG